MQSRRLREVAAIASEFGCVVRLTNGGHLRISHPDGWFVFSPSTPGDHRRDLKNLRAILRRFARRSAGEEPGPDAPVNGRTRR